MSVPPGSRLGPYEIVAPIGAGGMGEVFRALDTRLDRTVAIKVLPPHFASSPQLRERFDREARAISSLSHPNICTLFDVGHHDGIDYLVMEYLEGESLAGRLARGALPLADALRLGAQIADALAAAHRRGIVHRDLKPGNVMLTRSGAKLLDFGLAKAAAPSVASPDDQTVRQNPLTEQGTIIGTVLYMAPEQLESGEVDARSDIFALGAVLYEMVTGRRAFEGKTKTSLIAAIVERDPVPVDRLQPLAPASLAHVIGTCLAKSPDDRWQNASDVAKELRWIAASNEPSASALAGAKRRPVLVPVLLATAVVLAAAAAAFLLRRPRALEQPLHLSAILPSGTLLHPDVAGHNIAVSPDGSRLAIVAAAPSGARQIWLRSLADGKTEPLSGTDGAHSPFWSPDGNFLAFFARGQLKRIAVSGGPPQTICSASDGSGTWNDGNVILFAESEGREGIHRVSAAGGEPAVALPPVPRRPAWQYWPQFLPDGEHFLYLATNAQGETSLFAGSLEGGEAVRIPSVRSRALYADGHLIYVRDASLLAQKFDPESARLSGQPFVIASHIPSFDTVGWADFSVSSSGVLAYQGGAYLTRLAWFDRAGRELSVVGEASEYGSIGLSPDEKKLAFSRADPKSGNDDIWIYDLRRDVATRFTTEPGNEFNPIWHPDGDRLIFAYDVQGNATLNEKPLSSQGRGTSLLPMERFKLPLAWSADGRSVLYSDTDPDTGYDLWLLPLEGDRKPHPFQQSRFDETGGAFSPDGRWIAFVSSESGVAEVYVQRSDATGERWRISAAGGTRPQWRSDGKEIVYLASDDVLMSVPVVSREPFEAGRAIPLFRIQPLRYKLAANLFYMTADGQRFLVNSRLSESQSPPVNVVVKWRSRTDR